MDEELRALAENKTGMEAGRGLLDKSVSPRLQIHGSIKSNRRIGLCIIGVSVID